GRAAPARQRPRAVLVAEHADRCRRQAQVRALRRGEAYPAGAKHAQHVAMGEDRNLASRRRQLGDHAIGSLADETGVLASRAAVAPQTPSRPQGLDLRAWQPLIFAVVPLAQILANNRALA